MMWPADLSPQLIVGQLMLGLINGSFYALLSLGLSVIFGLMNVINFAHGTLFMVGAFVAYFLLDVFGIPYWASLLIVPIVVGAFAAGIERTMLRRLYRLDHVYGWLLTFGISLMLESLVRRAYGATGKRYDAPDILSGGLDLDFVFLPAYRVWVVVFSLTICIGVWYAIERTRLGSYLRAGTENPVLVRAFGINVPLMFSLTYAFGAALAGIAGVLAAPIFQVSPSMGSNIIIVLFAVVVIGGIGSIIGTIMTGLFVGIVEAFTTVIYPQSAHVVVFVAMAVVLAFKPDGLFAQKR
jgi:branched-chain amino acid transport system permease protein